MTRFVSLALVSDPKIAWKVLICGTAEIGLTGKD